MSIRYVAFYTRQSPRVFARFGVVLRPHANAHIYAVENISEVEEERKAKANSHSRQQILNPQKLAALSA